MDQDFDTVEALKEYLCGTVRLKFSVKVLMVLNFSEKHKDCVPVTGAVWCEDGCHFLVNTKIMASLLDLKANSINTNFREHGFKIISNVLEKDTEGLPPLPDLNNWKVRQNTAATFTRNSTRKDAENVPSLETKPQGMESQQNTSFIPQRTQEMCTNDFESELKLIYKILVDIPQPDRWKRDLLESATSFWTKNISPQPLESLDTVVQKLFPLVPGSDYRKQQQLRANFKYLIHTHSGSSQMNKTVYFSDFLRLFLRFGSPAGIREPLVEVTDFTEEPHLLRLSYDEEDDGGEEYSPRFLPGFCPTLHKEAALVYLRGQVVDKWVVMHSREANQFTLLIRKQVDNAIKNMALHIKYYAVPVMGGYRLSAAAESKEIRAKTWNEMLFERLGLNREMALNITCVDDEVDYVSYEEFKRSKAASMDGRDKYDEPIPMLFDFLPF